MKLKVGTRGTSKGIREPGKRQIEWKGGSQWILPSGGHKSFMSERVLCVCERECVLVEVWEMKVEVALSPSKGFIVE